MRAGLALARYLLPNHCVSCEVALADRERDRLVCGMCRSRWRRVPPGCARCGQPEPPVGPCRFCREWPPCLAWARSAVWLGDEARAAVHHLKYDGYHALAGELADAMVQMMPRPARAVLVPIPLWRKRERGRGYNQAAHLARALGRSWKLPCATELLRRARNTRSQTNLDPGTRIQNVAGAFRAREPSAAVKARGSKIILVDDILTTGATVVSAAQALSESGWQWVGVVTFARATPFAVRGMVGATAVLAS